MKSFSIEIAAIDSECYIVEAKDVKEAIEKAKKLYANNGKEDNEIIGTNILGEKEIKEMRYDVEVYKTVVISQKHTVTAISEEDARNKALERSEFDDYNIKGLSVDDWDLQETACEEAEIKDKY